MMPQALRLALKFSSTTTPSPALLFQASQVPAGYHAYLAFDTYLITEPRFSNITVASHLLDILGFEDLVVHISKDTSNHGNKKLTEHSAFPIENYDSSHHQQYFCLLTARPFRLLERRHVASEKILSSWLLHVSWAQLSEAQNQNVCHLEEIEPSMLQVRRLPLSDLCSHCQSTVLAVGPAAEAKGLRVCSGDSFFCIE